jgi:hypothetical protein
VVRWRGGAYSAVLLVVPMVAALILLRPVSPGITSAAAPPGTRLADAAAQLEAALKSGGPGFSFQVVSRSTLYAKPGGPKIEVPDPIDRYKTLGLADEYYLGASVATGIVTPDGYFLQMRRGPATKDAAPDFEGAEKTLAALVTGGKTFRNDGNGWYVTDSPPGIGLDRKTAKLLPKLLRSVTGATDEGSAVVKDKPATKIKANAKVADSPGLMAIDAESFTEFKNGLEFALDDQGRLVELHALMRNKNQQTFDLLVDTVITFGYEDPGPLPEPVPTWNPGN